MLCFLCYIVQYTQLHVPMDPQKTLKTHLGPCHQSFFWNNILTGVLIIYSAMCIFIVSRSMICCIGEISRPFFNQCSPLLSWHHFPLKTFSCRKYERLTILVCDLQARLLKGNFIVNPQSVYKTHEELWDGEL
jgi:hypothetical protein